MAVILITPHDEGSVLTPHGNKGSVLLTPHDGESVLQSHMVGVYDYGSSWLTDFWSWHQGPAGFTSTYRLLYRSTFPEHNDDGLKI